MGDIRVGVGERTGEVGDIRVEVGERMGEVGDILYLWANARWLRAIAHKLKDLTDQWQLELALASSLPFFLKRVLL